MPGKQGQVHTHTHKYHEYIRRLGIYYVLNIEWMLNNKILHKKQ